ncbi:ClpP/crotonase-like domain-containing protein [Aspergillus carlsbadensis]|nr:ClpP/crotonase-like domain-containing protein [Aspergillus carlsbadensis]
MVKISQMQTPKYPEFRNWLAAPDPSSKPPTDLDDEKCGALIENIIDAIQTYYLDRSTASQLAPTLRARVSAGIYNHVSSGHELARTLTTDLQALTGDKHFRCIFGIPPEEPSREEQLARLGKVNYGFGDVKTLDGDIAIIEITLFPPVHWVGVRERINDIMQSVSHASALIIDLRGCRGGDPKTVALVASYLVETGDSPWLTMVNPSDGVIEELRGELLPNGTFVDSTKSIYVLTSNTTISGGEDLAYGLQARKRGTVIGERTAGAANLPRACALPGGFVFWVPHKYPLCPVTGGNWEGVGVTPDVECVVEKAVERACEMARDGG